MHTHEHQCCSHECLHYCRGCNKVYCCKCQAEWVSAWHTWPWVGSPIYVGMGDTTSHTSTLSGDEEARETIPCGHSHTNTGG